MTTLDVLYICDDGFAEVAGVSITSLFENNPRESITITLYLLGVNISTENKKRFQDLSRHYGQKIILIDAAEAYQEVQKCNLDDYRGSAMTNLRLRFDRLVPETVKRLLYIDCDTIICDSLAPLAEFPMEHKLLGMVLDAYGKIIAKSMITDSLCEYGKRSGNHTAETYYNAGLLLIDCERWRKERWREKIDAFIGMNRNKLSHPDQDVLNIVCRDEIAMLPIRYNLQAVHKEYGDRIFFRYLAQERYYTPEEIEAARRQPAIVHLVRVLGINPWYTDGKYHPDYQLYMQYKERSEWRNEPPKEKKAGFIFLCERALKRLLPKGMFFPVKLAAMRMALKMEDCGGNI